MSKELLINQTLSECRVALLENNDIIDFLIDRDSRRETDHPIVGNVYKGKVIRVLPGMQSAFVDIGYEKAAFLYVDDAYIPSLDEQREMAKKSEQNAEDVKLEGELIPDEFSTLSEAVNMKFRPDVPIESFLKEGDEVLVQVAKEPISTKGPRVTRHITFAGRHIVYMPFIEHTGVSRRIENEKERDRLKDILESIRPEGAGIIARTVAEGQSYKVLKADYNLLVKMWKDVQKRAEKEKPPALIHKDFSFLQRVLRDILDDDVAVIVCDSKENINESQKFLDRFLPDFKGKIKHHNEELTLFEHYGIEAEIRRALSSRVPLKSGGSLNVDQTEALVSIDVNTGKFVGKKNLEDTILKNNLEAVKEIAYQLRVRNCGGIIIIDFIDMEKAEHREQVYNSLLEALKKDRAKTNVLPISALGLIEMTRKRTRDTLVRVMCDPCPYCEGSGNVKSIKTVCFDLVRELYKTVKKAKGSKIQVFAHPEVTAELVGEGFDIIDNIEEQYGKSVIVRSENNYHVEQFEIFSQEI